MTVTAAVAGALMQAACLYSGYSCENVPLPNAEWKTPCEIIKSFEGPLARCEGRNVVVAAFYIPGTNTMVLPTDLTEGNFRNDWQAVIVHEMVHHLQFTHGTLDKFECPALAEKEAYATEAKFRHANGMRPVPLNPVALSQLTTCPEPPKYQNR